MNRNLLIAVMCACLTACAASPVKDDSPASDLHALQTTMHQQLAPRTLPNGKTYCVEDSVMLDMYDDCAANLEEYAWLSEDDKRRALRTLDEAIAVMVPLTRWQRFIQKFRYTRPKNSATP